MDELSVSNILLAVADGVGGENAGEVYILQQCSQFLFHRIQCSALQPSKAYLLQNQNEHYG